MAARFIRAIVVETFGGPDVLKLKSIDALRAPIADEVLVRIHATGINPVETYIRTGTHALKPTLPYTPGFDGAGVVLAVGPSVSKFKEGSRVFVSGSITGTYAEESLCKESDVFPLPENVSFEEGASIGTPAFTAYRALFVRGRGVPGNSVLIHGASGAVGLVAVQLARSRGLTVFGTASTAEGKAAVAEAGAHHVYDHTSDGYLDEIRALTGGRGVDLIVEMAAHINLDKDTALLARGGRVLIVGNRGRIEIDPRNLMGKEASILGVFKGAASPDELDETAAGVISALAAGHLKIAVAKAYALEEAHAAHVEVIERREVKSGNIVFKH